jgi:hypothetical protein
MDVNQ